MKLCRFQPLEFSAKHPRQTAQEAHANSHAGIVEGGVIREISGELWARASRPAANGRWKT